MNRIALTRTSSFLAAASAAGCVAMLCGCATMQKPATAEARTGADMAALREDAARLQGRVEGIEAECRRLAEEQEKLSASVSRADDQGANAARRLDQVERSMNDLNAARAKDRELVIEELSARMAEALAKSGTTGRVSRPDRGGATGYEHVVQAGETLSQIAAAYQVGATAIIEANGLKNPDMLREGQKLFIPRQ